MNRRKFHLLAGTGVAALGLGEFSKARADLDPNLLKTTLTPMGSERAGNAEGTIPAWTGGYTSASPDWQGAGSVPSFIETDKPIMTIDSSNYTQYKDKLADSTIFMIEKYGYSLQVYPTRRPHALPQYIYDNIASNLKTATLEPAGGRFGFNNAYGGYPFPIPDTSDPLVAGAQLIWNHCVHFEGFYNTSWQDAWTINNGVPVLSSGGYSAQKQPYYDPNGTLETFDGQLTQIYLQTQVPADLDGQDIVAHFYTNAYKNPAQTWVLENGQGRVRKAPELQFDTPSSLASDNVNYDEYYGYETPALQYDWKLLEKKEVYIPYNNDKISLVKSTDLLRPKFMNPDIIRWELHRVWVFEGTLHPGYRNTMARRRYYADEDTWRIALGDLYDAKDNMYHAEILTNQTASEITAVIYQRQATHNLQTGDWSVGGNINSSRQNSYAPIPASSFDPQVMASKASF